MMSSLTDGMVTSTSPPSATASRPILLRHSTVPSGPRSRPRNLSQASTDTFLTEGVRSGDSNTSSPSCMVTDSILPPRSAMAVATMSRAPFTALRSVPVTSMNRSCFPTVTVVSLPLMIGGNDSTCPSASKMTGYSENPSRSLLYSLPFSFFSRIWARSSSSSIASGTNFTERGSLTV